MSYTYEHPRPAVTVDGVVLNYAANNIGILLIRRNNDPFKDYWALPGGFLEMEETPEEGAKRELKEETGLEVDEVTQVGAFGRVDRDPRGRVISITFLSMLKSAGDTVKGASDASEARWFDVHDLPPKLAFDHSDIINESLAFLRYRLKMSLIDQVPFYNLSAEEIQEINMSLTVS